MKYDLFVKQMYLNSLGLLISEKQGFINVLSAQTKV
jgi:hypothetical protein